MQIPLYLRFHRLTPQTETTDRITQSYQYLPFLSPSIIPHGSSLFQYLCHCSFSTLRKYRKSRLSFISTYLVSSLIVVQNSQESRRKYWATCSFACSALLTLFAPSAALFCSLVHSLTLKLVGKWMIRCLNTSWFCPIVLLENRQAIYIHLP